MASKTIAWADQSGDVITMTAPAWSGSQTVTLSTPENFGIARELNIVFYSESNPAVSATLNVRQAEATLALSETSLVFASDDTSEKTVMVTTNMSTLDGAQLTLEGDTASDFTLSELSALSNGQATFTIKPNSANSSQDPRNVTIKLTAGRLTPLSLPVTQDADAIQSVTYKDLQLTFVEGTLAGADISSGGTITAKQAAGTLITHLKFLLSATKVTTYSSGEVSEEQGVALPNTFVHFGMYIQSDPEVVFKLRVGDSDPEKTSDSEGYIIIDDAFFLQISPTTLWPSQQAKLYVSWHDTSGIPAEDSVVANSPTFQVEENKRESYEPEFTIEAPAVLLQNQAGFSSSGYANVKGFCVYSTGSRRSEYVPCSFEVTEGSNFLSITSQTPAIPGILSNNSTFNIQATSSNPLPTPRLGTVSIKEINSGSILGTIEVSQRAATSWGELSLSNGLINAYDYIDWIRIGSHMSSTAAPPDVRVEVTKVRISGKFLMQEFRSEMSDPSPSPVEIMVNSDYYFTGTLTSSDKTVIVGGTDVNINVQKS